MHPTVSRLSVATLITLLAYAGSALAFYEAGSGVKLVTHKDFDSEVLQDHSNVHMVEFFAPWCGHCQSLVPHYTKAAQSLAGMAKFVAVNCDEAENRPLCSTYGIQGFPTLKVFYPKAKKDSPESFTKINVDYQGARTAVALSDAVTDRIPSRVVKLTHGATNTAATGLADFMSTDTTLPKAILYTDKDKTTALFKSLSSQLHGRMVLAEARGEILKEKLKVVKAPTLMVVPAGEDVETVVYDGALKHANIYEFLTRWAKPEASAPSSIGKEEQQQEQPKTADPEPSDPSVAQATTQTELDTRCLSAGGICLLAVLNPADTDHESTLALLKTIKENDQAANGPFTFTWVDSAQFTAMAREMDLGEVRPKAVAIASKRKVYRVMLGAWSVEAMERFMAETVSGKGRGIVPLGFAVKMDQDDEAKTPVVEKDEL